MRAMTSRKSDPAAQAAGPLAAVDLGSNSFRLEIGQLQDGHYRRIDYLKETVRLGAGLDDRSRLTERAMRQGLACLARFAERLRGFAPHRVRVVATQTLREAVNREEFLERAEAVLGQPIEVISGREEGRLIYTGVTALLPHAPGRCLVIDIGGRSTEMILGDGPAPLVVESFRTGSVSLSLRYFGDGRFTPAAFRAAQIAAGAELEEGLPTFAAGRWQRALGSSGTVAAVAQVLAATGLTDGTITPAALRWCIEQCLQARRVDALHLPGLKEERQALIGGGLSVLYTVLMQFGIESLHPVRGALRHGVLVELHQRLLAAQDSRAVHDVRDASVRQLQRRFHVDLAQAERVQQVARALYERVEPDAPPETRRELQWAAALHEVGMSVSHHQYHRHGAYLVGHADAPGFSQSQQRRLATLLLGQRGGLGKLRDTLHDERAAWQVLCLRLAVLLCHGRTMPPRFDALRVQRQGREVRLHWPPGWADAHPRTLYLLQEEQAAWQRSGRLRLVLPRAN
jgi:Exopolyphosphatase